MLDDIRGRQGLQNFGAETYQLVQAVFAASPSNEDMRNIEVYADEVIASR